MLPGFSPAPARIDAVLPAWTKRQYQLDMSSKFFELVDQKSKRAPLAVMATGSGKTRTAAMGVVRRWVAERRGSVLWMAHLNTLIEQTRGAMASMLGEYIGLEQGKTHWESERVCVASIASLYSGHRLNRIKNRPTLIVWDEAHHSVSDRNKQVLKAFPNVVTLGLTATPIRQDKKSMRENYDSLAINYPIKQAIDDGYLVPILMDVAEIPDMDFSHLTRRQFTEANIGNVIGRDQVLNSIVEATLDRIGDRIGAMFFPTVKVAHLAAQLFNQKRPGIATAIDGTVMNNEEKKARIRAFKSNRYQIVCNVGVLAEGFDYPGIRFVGLCSHTESVSVYLQQLGRGTRNVCDVDAYETADERRTAIARSEKPDLLVCDYVGNGGKFDIVTAIDALADSSVDKETIDRAKMIAKSADGAESFDDVIEKAKTSIKREKYEEEAKKVASAGVIDIKFRRVDPFATTGGVTAPATVKNALDRKTNDLPARLREHGFNPDKMTWDEKVKADSDIAARKSQRLCSHKQVKALARSEINADRFTSKQAGATIGYILGHGGWGISVPGAVLDAIMRIK